MNRGKTRYLSLLVVLFLVGCARLSPGASSTGEAIAQISATHLSADASAALDSCGITNVHPGHPGAMTVFGIDVVTGMGLVTPARDAGKYARLGNPAELATDTSAWVITTHGSLSMLLGPTVESPTCVVIQGDWGNPFWFDTGNHLIGSVVATAFPEPSPLYVLPPLAP